MIGTWIRVLLAYPMALPLAFGLLSIFFPAYFSYDTETQRVTFTVTVPEIIAALPEIGAAISAAYAFILFVFQKWGIKPVSEGK